MMLINNNNSESSSDSSIIPVEKLSRLSPFDVVGDSHADSVAICYVESRGSLGRQSACYSHPPDEKKDLGANFAKLGRLLSHEVFPSVKPSSSLAVVSRSSDPLRPNLWSGFTIDSTLFFQPPIFNSWADEDFRNCIIAILELAENRLSCTKVVACLHKDNSEIADFVKALMYVGFDLCHPSHHSQSEDFLLLGYEL